MDLDNSVVENFLREAVIMRKFKHPNVMKLLGVTVHEEKPCIVMPMMMTDLKHYLKQNQMVRAQIFIHFTRLFLLDNNVYFLKQTLTENQLHSFSLGAAHGMEYLSDEKLVHHDLAARNCMLVLFDKTNHSLLKPSCTTPMLIF